MEVTGAYSTLTEGEGDNSSFVVRIKTNANREAVGGEGADKDKDPARDQVRI